ncbi:MAG TPA: DUF1513 domain-containing protein [Paracoccaceae bacterium]|nr:DUF1513 domain-containing protein [Paracoccaceae bacterium]
MATERITRRGFLAGAGTGLAASLAAGASWAEIGDPAYLAAAKDAAGGFRLIGLDAGGAALFDLALPDRGHAAAAHPDRAEAVFFARRPGTYALVVDCGAGRIAAELRAPEGRHFYGHGAFSADGATLYTTENDYAAGEGRVGIWDAGAGYRRLGEVASGGVGPHEMLLMPDGETLAVANGGILTHPDSGREKLNIPTMAPNLAYLRTRDGALLETVEPAPELRLNSLRHLAVAPDGLVAIAAQWQGVPEDGVPLLALHGRGRPGLVWAEADPLSLRAMEGYAGSVAFDGAGRMAAITGPRGGLLLAWDGEGAPAGIWRRADVCGIAPAATGWTATDGLGGVTHLGADLSVRRSVAHLVAWDNHLVRIGRNAHPQS